MPVVRRRDQHGVNILRRKQVFVILEPLGIRGDLGGLIHAGAEDIAQRGRVDGGVLDEGPQDPATPAAATDQPHVHLLVCARIRAYEAAVNAAADRNRVRRSIMVDMQERLPRKNSSPTGFLGVQGPGQS